MWENIFLHTYINDESKTVAIFIIISNKYAKSSWTSDDTNFNKTFNFFKMYKCEMDLFLI